MVVLVPYLLLASYDHNSHLVLLLLGVALFICGLALFITTLGLFIGIGRGTLAPWDPTKKLIIVGPYRYCRNPMISAVLFMIIGEALFFGSSALAVWALTFFVFNTVYFMALEEPGLLKKFGKSYAKYKQQVPRWLPKVRPYKG